jgi:hypothetical protein
MCMCFSLCTATFVNGFLKKIILFSDASASKVTPKLGKRNYNIESNELYLY